jgi:hypothetical protein
MGTGVYQETDEKAHKVGLMEGKDLYECKSYVVQKFVFRSTQQRP